MATTSKTVKKHNDPKYFNFVNLSKLIESVKANGPLTPRKNHIEVQTAGKNCKPCSTEPTQLTNERIFPKDYKKNKIKIILSLKLEADKSITNSKQLPLTSNSRATDKISSKIPTFEDCFPKAVVKNATPSSNRRENRSVSIHSSRTTPSHNYIQEKVSLKSPSGFRMYQHHNSPVFDSIDLRGTSPNQAPQFTHIAKFLSSFDEGLPKDENLIGSVSFSKGKRRNVELTIPDMSRSQTMMSNSKHHPQTPANQTVTDSSQTPQILKSDIKSIQNSFISKEKARLRKIVDVQTQKTAQINNPPLEIQATVSSNNNSKTRRKLSTDPEKEREISLGRTTKRHEKIVAEIRDFQDGQRENAIVGQENEWEDNFVGLKAAYQIRERNSYFAVRLEGYLDFLNKVNLSNMLFVMQLPKVRPQQIYRYHVKRGNNHMIIKKAFKQRWWWQPAEIGEGKLYDNVNFLWSPWRINDFVNTLKKHVDHLSSVSKDEPLLLETLASSCNDPNDEMSLKCLNIAKTIEHEQNKDAFTNTDPKLLANLKRIFSNIDFKHQGLVEQINGERNDRKSQAPAESKKNMAANSRFQFNKMTETLTSKMYNHLENNFLLSNKKALFLNLRQYYLSQKMDPFELIPVTFHIKEGVADQEFGRFKDYYVSKMHDSAEKNIWIIKPGENTNRGVGITICEKIEEIEQILTKETVHANGKPKTFIVQKYIEKPLLYQRRKFDIRCFILVTSINGIQKGYWYQDGYVRTSSTEFTLESLDNKQIHLTNDAVQKKCDDYGKHESGNKISFSDLQKYFDAAMSDKKINFMENIYPQLKKLALDAILSVFGRIDPYRRDFSFELFGLDFMIDESLKPYLIEINTNPCLELSSPLLVKLIPAMIENLFRMVIDPIFPPPFEWPISRRGWIPENCLENNKFELIFDERGADTPRIGINTANQHLGQAIDECEEDIDTELME